MIWNWNNQALGNEPNWQWSTLWWNLSIEDGKKVNKQYGSDGMGAIASSKQKRANDGDQ